MAGTNSAAAERQPPAAISAQIIAEDLEEWPKDPLFQQKRVEATKDEKTKMEFFVIFGAKRSPFKNDGKKFKEPHLLGLVREWQSHTY